MIIKTVEINCEKVIISGLQTSDGTQVVKESWKIKTNNITFCTVVGIVRNITDCRGVESLQSGQEWN